MFCVAVIVIPLSFYVACGVTVHNQAVLLIIVVGVVEVGVVIVGSIYPGPSSLFDIVFGPEPSRFQMGQVVWHKGYNAGIFFS